MEVQSILSGTGYLYVLRGVAEGLHRRGQIERYLRLVRASEDKCPKEMVSKKL
jgi:hypothetical protein